MTPPYRVLIVDDHSIVRSGLRVLLGSTPGLEICAEATNGPEGIEFAYRYKPDLVILDLTLPHKSGLEVLEAIHADNPQISVLILTMHYTDEVAREALRLGAVGYVLKSDADTELLSAVDHVRNQQPFFTGQLALSMAQHFVSPQAIPGEEETGPLTRREMEVVQWLADGKTNKEVATALKVSVRTVESHRNHIMRKLRLTNFSDLVRYAVRNNLVEL